MPQDRVVAVGGHESDDGRALRALLDARVPVVARGRALYRSVAALRERGERVCVVPMTLGRDPGLTADAARTLRALSEDEREGLVLAEPFGTADHLVGWLRAAATKVPAEEALLVTAPSGDPFADADLYRIARLVRQYGRHRTVEVALVGGDPDPAGGVRRCRLLGAEHVTLLPAAWVTPPVPDPSRCAAAGPLLTASAVAGVLEARARQAWERRERHGDDGLSRGLTADHTHGYAHSHGDGDGHAHDHGHGHGHGQGGGRPRTHGYGHGDGAGHELGRSHAHDHDYDHDHGHSHGGGHAQARGHGHAHGEGHGDGHRHGDDRAHGDDPAHGGGHGRGRPPGGSRERATGHSGAPEPRDPVRPAARGREPDEATAAPRALGAPHTTVPAHDGAAAPDADPHAPLLTRSIR
ncbi:cobalamin biosynthesis protein CbiX [Streptomyces sp. NPDC005012]|uniref:sirohydrochlorin chelatase n=1 Tax=Streptomyces sp. NPDC005012 TaxID=3154558 RepID=UPI0033A59F18